MNIINSTKTFIKYKGLLKQLISRDIKLKYRRSMLGYIWSILNPLMIMIVLTVVFSYMFKRDIKNFPLYYLCGQILFNFFSMCATMSIHSIVDSGALIKKIYVPKYIFVVSAVTTQLISEFCFSLGALLIVMLATHANFSFYNLLFFVPAVEVYIFSLGVGLFLAQANVFFRDIQYIWKVIITIWLYITPIFYPLTMLPPYLQKYVTRFNPMYMFIEQFRDLMYLNRMLNPTTMLKGFTIGIVALLIGMIFFKKNQDKFILYI
ncbi:ABC transporter permease [Treponema sp.]|uniref:ABC transporter permease n=1 Tax=Treponema sp. TaxID=166 RepID=UPI0025CBBAD9|nr:ABC transporter permease [Treponema sp.]MCR5217745.1 ABC transporter permease [Treponema sp.]